MKILLVDKYHYIKGGSETAFFSQMNLFKNKGHDIISFSMNDENNIPSPYSKYFVKKIDYLGMKYNSKIINAFKIIYSFEAKQKILELIKETKPNLAHLHIFQHQLSPSILWALKAENVPIIHTIHDLKIVCPNYLMLTKNKVCEKCLTGKFYNCAINKCSKDSLLNSIVLSVEAYFHRWIRSYSLIDAYICPSNFHKNMLKKGGVDEDKLFHIPNFIDTQEFTPVYEPNEDYITYFGRLSYEKGVFTLLNAVSKVRNVKLVIIGNGPIKDLLNEKIKELHLQKRVWLAGYKTGRELYDIVKKSKFVVVPSECYENAPYSILEAMALGKPVIGSRIGGIPELIQDGVNGYLFEHGNVDSLTETISMCYEDRELLKKMGIESRKIVETRFASNHYYNEIIKVYSKVLDRR